MCKEDREKLLELLCDKYSYVMGLMKIIGVNDNDIEDLTSEVFIDAFRGLHKLKNPDNMQPWLNTIAKNRATKYFKKRAKRKEIFHMVKCEMGEMDLFETMVTETEAEKLLQEAERRDLIDSLMESLSEVNKKIIQMRFWGGYKHDEIADILGLNINTEKSLYRRSLKELKWNYMMIFGRNSEYEWIK